MKGETKKREDIQDGRFFFTTLALGKQQLGKHLEEKENKSQRFSTYHAKFQEPWMIMDNELMNLSAV